MRFVKTNQTDVIYYELVENKKATGTASVVKGKPYEIDSFVIWQESDRKKGLGSKLLKEIISDVKRNRLSNELIVKSDNDAVAFYEKHGFVKSESSDKTTTLLKLSI